MSLPPPRRIISGHDLSDGTVLIQDDNLEFAPSQMGNVAMAYVQKDFPADPALALDGATRQPDNMWVQSTGVSIAFLDFVAGMETPNHFTTTIDYVVVLNGTVDLIFHDGTTKTLKQGDLVVQVSGIHKWINRSSETCRVLATAIPAKQALVNGQGLEQFGAYKVL